MRILSLNTIPLSRINAVKHLPLLKGLQIIIIKLLYGVEVSCSCQPKE